MHVLRLRVSPPFSMLFVISAIVTFGCDIGFGQTVAAMGKRLIANSSLERTTADERRPQDFEMTGDVSYGYLTVAGADVSGWGLKLHSGKDLNGDGMLGGAATTTVSNLPGQQRWYRLKIYGMAQDGFAVERDQLFLQVEFFKNGGKDPLDKIKKQFYPQVERERKDLKDSGTNKNLGLAVWRVYELDFRTPFPEIDLLRVGIGFAEGVGKGEATEFHVDSIELQPIAEPTKMLPTKNADQKVAAAPARDALVPIGGRWYYDPQGEKSNPPAQFDHTNVDRLYYDAGRLETPFANNTTAWMREGWMDRSGKVVDKDRFVPDNVIITWTAEHLVIQSKNLPNHPTATFPDRWRALDGNPNFIQEKELTFYLPMNPQPNPKAVAMTAGNANKALNGGPIGVAINGIVFFNPFDEGNVEAVWRLDRCCGHPSPNEMYHYHKYPVCLNTPWADEGESHSPLIGFAFDGFPIYGPYERPGVMAKDDTANPINEFNIHRDDLRGWHYHVTPGRFPHVIGGYWGQVDSKNTRRGPRRN